MLTGPVEIVRAGVAPAETGAPDKRIGRLRAYVYAIIVLSSLLQSAIAPLLPSYAHRFQLTGVGTAALLAATAVTTLIVSLPAGKLSDHFGARALTLWAGWLMVVATLGQAFSPTFTLLLASRLLFGVGYGIVWTTALAWLANTSHDESTLAGTITASGVGCIAGPAFAGFIAQYFGIAAPFVIAAALTAVVTVLLTTIDLEVKSAAARVGIFASLRAAAADLKIIGATVAVVAAGASAAVATLLGSLALHESGVSEGSIGLVFSVSAVLFIIGSSVTSRFGERANRLRTVLGAGLVLALVMSPTSLSTTPVLVIVMLCATALVRSVLWVVAYPLGGSGAKDAGLGVGVVMGLLNVVWAVSAIVCPLVVGALIGPLGLRGTFAVSQLALGGALLIGWAAFRLWTPGRDLQVGNA
ncbi:MAG: MFS transporter [Acidimicrobiales bacterium]|jgi:predicted MFS family arabinose efflux permease